jgi:nickel transport protein
MIGSRTAHRTQARPDRWLALVRTTFVAIALALAPLPAVAHKVIAGVFPSGSAIEGEIGFSSGDMAADQLVEVFDAEGNRLGEVITDADGFFLFTPVSPVTHVFRAQLGAGHVAETRMEAAEVARIVSKAQPMAAATPGVAATLLYRGAQATTGPAPAAAPAAPQSAASTPGAAATLAYAPAITVAALTEEERTAIARIVREETRPLRQEIAAYREKNDLQTILGGIGYIVGLFGIGFYIAARRRLKGTA